MSLRATRNFYWATFALSIFILCSNFGIGLIALAIFLIPITIMHFTIGMRMSRIKNHTLIIISSLNLLAFVLVRPDGVHVIQDNGLSSLLNFFGIHGGYSSKYESHYFIVSLVLLISQLTIEIVLMRSRKSST